MSADSQQRSNTAAPVVVGGRNTKKHTENGTYQPVWGDLTGQKTLYMDNKIREAIRRLEELPPSKWDASVALKVKDWLFPRIIAYMDGYKEKSIEEQADEVFNQENGEGDLT